VSHLEALSRFRESVTDNSVVPNSVMRGASVLVILGACASDSSSSGAELCNGVDDNSDGVIDEGCPCTAFDISFPVQTTGAAMAWVGDGYRVVAGQNTANQPRDNTIQTIDASGALGSVFTVSGSTEGQISNGPTLAWSGTVLGVVWTSNAGGISLARFDHAGTRLGVTSLPDLGIAPVIAWAGDRFVVAGLNHGITLAEVLPDGTVVGVTHSFGPEPQAIDSVAVSAGTYALGYQVFMKPYVLVVDRATMHGTQLEPSLGVSNDTVSVAAHGSSFGATRGLMNGDLFQGIDPTNTLLSYNDLPWPEGHLLLTDGPSGFRVYGYFVEPPSIRLAVLDVTVDGTATSAETTVATFDALFGTAAAAAGGRYALASAFGQAYPNATTTRVIQSCP
jgi:hypothetical protein